ncbi:11434_t:CDS:2 [Diversispora eburnea]|uniref:11434_t:CDS:1 n=1 Tax=Diversispora eburnea TaxID=1213867 RepID=A0A9N9CQQ2_9GLOM|nr:11434_t:CDS:2 [Diversispora eburnea]
MMQPNNNEEVALPSSNGTIMSNNNLQSSDSNEIDIEDPITNPSISFCLQHTITAPFVGQVFNTWDNVDKYFYEYSWQEKFVFIKTRNDQDPPPEQTCRPSLCELATTLDLRLKDEAQYVNHKEWYHANTSAQLNGASAECFPEVDHILKEYLTEEILSCQRHEITQSLYYFTIMEIKELSNNKHTGENYDIQKIHLTSLLEDLSSKDIIKIYKAQ